MPDTIEYLVYFSRQNLSFFRETFGEVNIWRVVREVEGAALEMLCSRKEPWVRIPDSPPKIMPTHCGGHCLCIDGGIRSLEPSARWAHQTAQGRLLSKGAEAQRGAQAEDASFAKGIPDSRRRGLHIARDSFFKSYLSLISSLLLSAKDHACSTCSLASALTTASRRYHSFAVFPLFIAV